MKYKFISKETKEEIPHVWIEGFVYLLSSDKVNKNDYWYDEINKEWGKSSYNNLPPEWGKMDKIISTNNPSLTDIPQIQLEEDVNEIAQDE